MNEIQELEELKQNYLTDIKFKNTIEKLEKNKEFKAFVEEYCVRECARLTALSNDLNLKESTREVILNNARGCGYLTEFLTVRKQLGLQAEAQLKELEESIIESMKEEENQQ